MKRMTTILIALIMSVSLAACGSKPAVDTPVSSTVESSTDGTAGVDVVKLSLMDPQAYAIERSDEVINNFCKTNNVEIDIQHAANDYPELLAARINSGQIPDIFVGMVGPQLNSLLEYALDMTDDPLTAKLRDDALASTTFNGRVLAMPWIAECFAFMYNKTLFDQAGITDMPQTIDELEDICKVLQSKGITPFACGYQSSWVLGQFCGNFVAHENIDPKNTVAKLNSGELTFDNMKYLKNMFRVLDLTLDYGVDKTIEYDWERSEAAISNGDAAIIHMGNWCEATLKEFNPDIEVAFMPIPVTDDGSVKPKMMVGISDAYIINKDSPNTEVAKKLVDYYLTSDDGMDFMSQTLGAIPPTKIQPSNVDGMLSNDASSYVAKGLSLPWVFQQYPIGFDDQLWILLQSYAAGDIDMESCINSLQNEWEMYKE